MNKLAKANTKRIIFSQWTRKSYAIFSSLKKVVKIARLFVDICIASQLKSISLISFINLIPNDNNQEEDAESADMVDYQILLQLMPVASLKSDISSEQNLISITRMESPYSELCRVWAFCF